MEKGIVRGITFYRLENMDPLKQSQPIKDVATRDSIALPQVPQITETLKPQGGGQITDALDLDKISSHNHQ